MNTMIRLTLFLIVILTASLARGDGAGGELFESRIRPVLVEQCYSCHNSETKAAGGLALDFRDGLREGGTSGPALVPGKPDASLILRAMRHIKDAPRMPKDGAKLSETVVADFARWITLGAPDPRDEPPTAAELQSLTSWEAVRERRKAWWCFQPLTNPAPPRVRNEGWSDHPIDRFLLDRMEQGGLEPSPLADRPTLIRRVTFALTGLPPTSEEIERFVRDRSPRAYEDLVDRLLASPRFGERWARHAMDWMRYADSHGSEGDPSIPFAWRYRDYLIRAFNADVPYDQLIREQIAGDLLPDPRINRDLGINESALGIGHYRMVPHGYAPTDALDEQVTFTDNQIDVLTKAFLGLTVSCARCHNHKFDPIGQRDFYALYGIMASSRPALITVDTPERLNTNRAELQRLKAQIQRALATAWSESINTLPERLNRPLPEEAKNPGHPLHAWSTLGHREGDGFAKDWSRLVADKLQEATMASGRHWDLTGDHGNDWFKSGSGLSETPSRPGEFRVLPEGNRVVANVYPAGIYTHLISDKHNGVLMSPRFKIDSDMISVRAAGGGGSRVRIVVQNYPRVVGATYKSAEPDGEGLTWVRWDVRYWKGEWAYLEIATSEDLPIEIKPNEGRSWFGIREVVCHDKGWTPPETRALPARLALGKPDSPAALAKLYIEALGEAIAAWAKGEASDEQADLLGAAVRARWLPDTLDAIPSLVPLVAEFRRLEAEIPVPTRSPGVLEGTAFDQPLLVRGNIKAPGAAVPRGYLEVFGAAPYATRQSGRRELADDLASPRNPLTARVIVNRLWHHLFGRGIVATPDNFGRLGELPTHPELLDALASRFLAEGWSIKPLIRWIVISQAYQMSSTPSPLAGQRDPTNQLLSHYPVRRLEAEAIRDAILAVSGRLDLTMYGPDVRGRTPRRSVYVRVQRNELDPFLNVFDAPEPLTARGRRDNTNIPAQSLTLLNDPWVIDQARRWAEEAAREPAGSDDERIGRMFVKALGRPPVEDELTACRRFLADSDRQRDEARREARRIDAESASRRNRLEGLIVPVRERLTALARKSPVRPPSLPEPLARWEFDDDLRDALGRLDGKAVGKARLEGGALVLDGESYVKTPPLPRDLKEKTLEASVMLDRLDERGAGVFTVETVGGGVFDAIVFGEMTPGHWIAGSNNFRRTESFGGTPEVDRRAVHLALVYGSDGTITAYRDGKPYGRSYRSTGPIRFEAGASHILFGLRHSPAGGGKLLRGKILQARLYDRALRPDEIAATAGNLRDEVSEAEILAALPAETRAECERLTREIADLDASRPARIDSEDSILRWQELAHSMINLKEFIYIK